MKNPIILLSLLISCMFTACYEDESNTSIQKINPLVIDLGGASKTLSVYLLDTLEISPIVYKIGVEDADLSYKWEISGNDIVPQVLGTNMILKTVVGVPESSDEYSLLLTVTDNTTLLQSYEEFKVKVSAKLGQGLLVADTKDELHTDLNLIVSSNFRGGVLFNPFNEKNTITMTSVYSQCNFGQLLDGKVTQMLAPGEGNGSERTLTLITDHSAYRMDPYEYILNGVNNDFFYVHVPEQQFKPEAMVFENTQYHELMIINGILYCRDTRWGNLNYGAPLETSDFSEYEVHCGFAFSTEWPNYRYLYFYDELNDRFLECQDYERLLVHSKFKPNLGKQKPLYMGEGNASMVYTVFRSKETENYLLYTFEPGNAYLGNDFTVGASYHLDACNDIKNAIQFASSRSEKVLYYTTPQKIYASLLTEENPQAHECFSIDDLKAAYPEQFSANTKISSIYLWNKSNQGTIRIKDSESGGEPTKISAQFRMMVITIWDEGTQQGSILTIPIMNLGAGVLEKDTAYWTVYSGFGRILCIAPQSW